MDDKLKQLLLLGREHYEKREYDQAEPLLQQVVKLSDRYADVFDMLGVISHTHAQLPRARAYFERAIALNPNYTEAQLNLMVTLNDLGDYEAAREIYGNLRTRDGTEQKDSFAKGKIANMHAELASAYQDLGMSNHAAAELEKAVALCPEFSDLRTRLAILYRDNGDPSRALLQVDSALAAKPDYSAARVLRGVLFLSQGDPAKAADEFNTVLASDPDNKSARMYLKIAASRPSQVPPQPDSSGSAS